MVGEEDASLGLKQRLRGAGLRSTAPRLAVLELLERAGQPLSHGEVVEQLGETTWDQATLYRNLVKLVEVGLARVAAVSRGVTRYELVPEAGAEGAHQHAHFICKDCGQVQCLPELEVSVTAALWGDVWLQDAELQLVGRCQECRPVR